MRILVVDDEKYIRFALSELLENAGYEAVLAETGEEGLEILSRESVDIAIIDYQLPGMNGLELLQNIKKIYTFMQVILITAFGSEEIALQAIRAGAYDYVAKPFENETLLNRVEHIIHTIELKRDTDDDLPGLFTSTKMLELIDRLKTIAKTDVPVILTGESGTGKEIFARITHKYSLRNGPFISLNCSAIPENLFESELYGAEKGAYTGATTAKVGFFEQSMNGTLFLDEIGEMPVTLQAKLLRVLQEGEFFRVGGSKPIKTNTRIIAATNRDIGEAIAEGRFREDLFYRLNVFNVVIPPLRNRKDEIKPLAFYLLKQCNTRYQKKIAGFNEQLLTKIENYSWPGNVRQLKNSIEKAVILCQDEWISAKEFDLPEDTVMDIIERPEQPEQSADSNLSFLLIIPALSKNLTTAKKEISDEFEKQFILYYLKINGNNVKKTADMIGLFRQNLYKRMKELQINKE